MNKKVAIILVNYKDYAEHFLSECWASLRAQDYYGEMKIFIVDNASTDSSASYLKDVAPTAEIIRNHNNDGFAKGNNDAINVALALNYDYVILFNMDTIVEKNCVSELVKAIESDEKIGAVQARLMLYPDKDKINSLGNDTHFLGFGYCKNYKEKYDVAKVGEDLKPIFYPSGAAVLFRGSTLKEVGLLDEELWMYNEDQDLGWRVWLTGYSCILANSAVVYHKYEFSRSISKYYWMDRNRIIVMLKNYSSFTLILILPAFIIMEIGLILFSIRGGWFMKKLKVWAYFLNPLKWIYIIKARRHIQRTRRCSEREILKMVSGRIWYQEVGSNQLKIANIIFNIYFKIVRKIVCWTSQL
jgi:hypothetical protein